MILGEQTVLFTDSRYLEQAKQECPGRRLVEMRDSYPDAVAAFLGDKKVAGLGLDGEHLSFNEYCSFKEKLSGINIIQSGGLVEKLRQIKDDEELGKIKKAAAIADQAFAEALPMLKPGITERAVALKLETIMKDLGAEDLAFKTIVASGARSALPHGIASEKRLEKGDLVTMDFGAVYQGYCSDITRTVVLGQPTPKQLEIYRIVLAAQLEAIKTVGSGTPAREVDRAAREVIRTAGYGDYFGHGAGHGLGLYIHEDPRISHKDATILQKGMTVTIEPGIYLPDWGGVRIEDTVAVEDGGCELLTKSPKTELLSL